MNGGWSLAPDVIFLNHGSFGACPRAVLARQQALREELEREPVAFMLDALPVYRDEARAALASFVGAQPDDLAFVTNATYGVNAVLRSFAWSEGDELLTTDHAYNACKNALAFVAERDGAQVVVAEVPFPLASPEQVVEAVLSRVTSRTKLALLDHITSATGLIFPIKQLVKALHERGVEVLVDGAHAPGMVSLSIEEIGAEYYTGNCHKWLCAPKGAAFLWVRRDRQEGVRPLAISHGASEPEGSGRSRFLAEFDWTGTDDPTPWLCLPEALTWMAAQREGGWPTIMAENRALALEARTKLCDALDVAPPAPPEMIGALASVLLPPSSDGPATSAFSIDPLQRTLREQFGIQVPVYPWHLPPYRFLRISAQLYNQAADYDALVKALRGLVDFGLWVQ